MKYTLSDISNLYKSEAEKHGQKGTSTIQDIRTRYLEMEAIFSYIRDGMKVLEVGCGNGFVARRMVEKLDVDLDAFDYSPDLIEIAIKSSQTNARGKVRFSHGDVLKLDVNSCYDLIFTERVLQNLLDWPAQQVGLTNIVRALKPGGLFVMEESFWSGLNTLNAARAELDIEPVPESWHNTFFQDDHVLEYMAKVGSEFVEENNFLSGYYFGSRVLLPALMPKGKKPTSASVLNDFFCKLPPAGNFSPMKIIVFRKTCGEER
jgi:ubiquinone/menaquinone biosynthesis C-methylase UbiE